METLTKSFVIRRVRSGESIYLLREVRTADGTGAALVQTCDAAQGRYVPDWTDASLQPIVSLRALSSGGATCSVTAATVTYDSTPVSFSATADAEGWQQEDASAPRFALRLADGKAEVRIVANLAAGDGANKTLSYRLTGTTAQGTPFAATGVAELYFPAATPGTYRVQILADHTTLGLIDGDTEVARATLTLACGVGADPLPEGAATADWAKNGMPLYTGRDPEEPLTLTRADINGSDHYSVALVVDGTVVARDGISIYDVADEWLVAYRSTGGDGTVAEEREATYEPYLLRNLEETATPEGTVFTHELYNAAGERVRTAQGTAITVSPQDCAYTGADGQTHYGDVELRGSASW